ncbi:MAG: toprim domain-containing protein [Thaumarchaeota archaeon]|nr:toprim domain-containing protein [Nitrososphaerota archaeon]
MLGRKEDELIQKVALFIRNLNHEAEKGSLIVVEGKRDKAALRSLGFLGKMVMLCHNGSINSLAESASSYKKTILLLDLDNEGRVLTKKAAKMLQGKTVIDLAYRKELGALTKGRIRHVEELIRFKDFIMPIGA